MQDGHFNLWFEAAKALPFGATFSDLNRQYGSHLLQASERPSRASGQIPDFLSSLDFQIIHRNGTSHINAELQLAVYARMRSTAASCAVGVISV